MKSKTLHITQGQSLTQILQDLDIPGTYLTWQEMLCEGPTPVQVDSQRFFDTRSEFLKEAYDIEVNDEEIKSEIRILDNPEAFSEIVLWFTYDLFCHINLLGVIKLLQEKNIKLPLYLVCSGRISGETNLKGLTELTQDQLLNHYESKVLLKQEDVELARSVWHIYCGKDHNLLKPYIVKKSAFLYLNSCLKAHLKRFPDLKNGLSTLEENILILIRDKNIKTRHHLLGYALNFQGYYGYIDMQLDRKIASLSMFFEETESYIKLNRKGHEALIGSHNYASEINNCIVFGGVNRLDFYFSTEQNKLIKKN
ncbi:DUF1835 domain-containing protein [Bizionia myxarmorum]|uniref:DUF1835 domain-containing protein n=1 Tax=Bizionia myxarmorum TaxID=291186 RepID=A0A5D0R4D7_9FLAO|nr:DUF1835 domain-containing protein [Bizionia myxarmorum]TYB76333.1 DUF1835 domain-containing protein [Bizionia myxarmorum]